MRQFKLKKIPDSGRDSLPPAYPTSPTATDPGSIEGGSIHVEEYRGRVRFGLVVGLLLLWFPVTIVEVSSDDWPSSPSSKFWP